MIKFNELKKGDYVLAESDGQSWRGEVTNFNHNEKEVCVNNGVQELYFPQEALFPLPVDEKQLLDMKFTKLVNENGKILERRLQNPDSETR